MENEISKDIIVVSNKISYLEKTSQKIQDLCTKNIAKTSKTQRNEMIDLFHVLENSVLLKMKTIWYVDLKLSTYPINIPVVCTVKTNKLVLKVKWKYKGLKID